jgi:Mg/Co/Ni transporter MgtE
VDIWCFLAAVWSFFYDRVWHAIVHAIVVGLLAHLFLQIAAVLHPVLPFATEPKRVERSTGLFTLMFVGGMMGGMIPLLLPLVYARPILSAAFFVALLGATAVIEHLLRRRAVAMARDLEFVS